MNNHFDRLVDLLKELFQLNQPDLDFGIYPIMHARSNEIIRFLENDLLAQVTDAFVEYKSAGKAELERQLEALIAGIEKADMDANQSPKVRALRQRISDEGIDTASLENEVYERLFSFFRRYYHKGDFLSKRVYKPGVYAIPYEGEEVKLHWANRDQHYIKTSEHLQDYVFMLKPDNDDDQMRVRFQLVDAAEDEHGNAKSGEGKERVFILIEKNCLADVHGELIIKFQYRPATIKDWPALASREASLAAKRKPPTQKVLLTDAARRISGVKGVVFKRWLEELTKPRLQGGNESATSDSHIQWHLAQYTKRNTFDYFVHKDLGQFLRRELDYYIKNEIMNLDDIDNAGTPKVEQYLSKITIVRKIAHKLIEFLAQIEDFQKKLWLKRKFVVETSYCITLGKIPEELYPAIASNNAQREEWVALFGIDELKRDGNKAGYSKPLKIEFLKRHPSLPVDTRHFPESFSNCLLDTFSDLDRDTDAILISGENVHALSLLSSSMRKNVGMMYIDPPYNTGGDGFLFKDNYRHSSWLSMISDRLAAAKVLMADEAVMYASIDANERTHLESALIETFGIENRIEEIIWEQNTTKNRSPTYSTNHEYVEVFARDLRAAKRDPRRFRVPKPGLTLLENLISQLNSSYPTIAEIEAKIAELHGNNKERVENEGGAPNTDDDAQNDEETTEDWKGLYNYRHAEYRDQEGNLIREEDRKKVGARIWVFRISDTSMPQVKEDSQKPEFRDKNSPEFRFYKPIHPKTKKPCRPPQRGWAWPYEPHGRQTTCFTELAKDNRIVWGEDETTIPQKKTFIHETKTNVPKSVLKDFTDGEKQLIDLFGRTRAFSNPKPTTLIERFVEQTTWNNEWIMDFFAGSGTTGHAVISKNRQDGARRRFALVEIGEHFERVLLPRIKKITFCQDWKQGKPKNLPSPEEISRGPKLIKIIRLESYEDTLKNLSLKRSATQEALIQKASGGGKGDFKEQYFLRYMLDAETRGSKSLLNVPAFSEPTSYKMCIKVRGGDESRETNVDLLETFNWLLGLTVESIAMPRSFSANFARDAEERLVLKGSMRETPTGSWWFRPVTGKMQDGRRAVIIWRRLTGNMEEDNLVLETWFVNGGYSSKDKELSVVYVNGDNNLENLKGADDIWKVRLIEEDFHRLMFDTGGI